MSTDRDQGPRYSAWGLPTAEPNIFSSTDIEHAARRRREIASLYSMSALTNIVHHIDQTTTTFLEKMAAFSSANQVVDMAEWFQYFAFDTIGSLTVAFPGDDTP